MNCQNNYYSDGMIIGLVRKKKKGTAHSLSIREICPLCVPLTPRTCLTQKHQSDSPQECIKIKELNKYDMKITGVRQLEIQPSLLIKIMK